MEPNEMLAFPVYPEELDDGVVANYEDMSEMLYQYEPWKVYKSSGPREMTFTFNFHRDMWSGQEGVSRGARQLPLRPVAHACP